MMVKLPTKGDWETLVKWGVLRTSFSESDLFCECTLPEGWTKEETSHPMRSKLIDEKGRVRATIFTKLASWDTEAIIHIREKEFIVADVPGILHFDEQTGRQCGVKDAIAPTKKRLQNSYYRPCNLCAIAPSTSAIAPCI